MRLRCSFVSICIVIGCSSAGPESSSATDAATDSALSFEEGGADFDTGPVDTDTGGEASFDGGPDFVGLGKVGCVASSVHFVGTHGDGSAWFDRTWTGGGLTSSRMANARFDPRGILSLRATDTSPSDPPFDALGVLFMNADASDPGAVYCASGKTKVWETPGSGSSFNDHRFVLRSLVKAGNCGSGPIEPDMRVCGADSAYDAAMDPRAATDPICVPDAVRVVGSAAGATIDGSGHLEGIDSVSGPPTGWTEIYRMSDTGVFFATWTGDEKKGTGFGAIALPAKIDPKRTVFCADTVEVEDVPHAFRIKLVAPRRIGSCIGPTIDGQIEGCF